MRFVGKFCFVFPTKFDLHESDMPWPTNSGVHVGVHVQTCTPTCTNSICTRLVYMLNMYILISEHVHNLYRFKHVHCIHVRVGVHVQTCTNQVMYMFVYTFKLCLYGFVYRFKRVQPNVHVRTCTLSERWFLEWILTNRTQCHFLFSKRVQGRWLFKTNKI